MRVHDVVQGSESWRRLRLGVPTASSFDRIITVTGKPSAQADGYMYDLLAEMVLGHPLETVKTAWMQHGTDTEAEAVAYYDFQNDCESTPVGFITTDSGMIGASPDRIVSQDLLLEVKCPSPGEHLSYVLGKCGAEAKYRVQLQGQLYVADAYKATDIITYCKGFPHAIVRVERDPDFQKLLDAELQKFVAKIAEKRAELDKRGLLAKPEVERDHSGDFLSDADIDLIIEAQKVSV